MDLIYTNAKGEDIGVLNNYTFDLAFGKDENDFELTMSTRDHCCEKSGFVYIEGTEYGGIIDKMSVTTKDDTLSYMGRTWHGILESKVIEPTTVSGKASVAVDKLIRSMGLSNLFIVDTEDYGLAFGKYSITRPVKGYSTLAQMVDGIGGKLKFRFSDGKVTLSVVPIVDYSQDEQFDNDQVELDIEKTYNSVNHLVCVGKEDSQEKVPTVHLYKNAKGKFQEEQVYFGINEITDIYEYSNQDDLAEEKLQQYLSADKVQVDFAPDEAVYDVGDIIGAKEIVTGISVKEKITKKIVTIKQGSVNINYKVGE